MSTPHLHARYPELRDSLPHLRLGTAPTPVRALPQLSLGHAPVWVKDDGAFGDGGWGGNKVRKLEWLLPDVQRRHRRTILTVGGLGTNWGLATSLYAGPIGLRTALALVDQPIDVHVLAQLERLRASGATLHFTHSRTRTIAAAPWLFLRHSSGGRPPYFLPPGGSSPVGALGYVEAAFELADQVSQGSLPEPSHVVAAVGSGGTVAGLLLGLRLADLRTKVVGIVVNDTLRLDQHTLTRLASRCESLLRARGARLGEVSIDPADLLVERSWLGPSYGECTPQAVEAQRLAKEQANLALDPVYTAKAMAGLLAMNDAGRFGSGPVLYLHTDGPRGTAGRP